MTFKTKNLSEMDYWKNQIKRHHTGKLFREFVRNNPNKTYKQLASKLNINRKTLWALMNGLTTPSEELIKRLDELEKSNRR